MLPAETNRFRVDTLSALCHTSELLNSCANAFNSNSTTRLFGTLATCELRRLPNEPVARLEGGSRRQGHTY